MGCTNSRSNNVNRRLRELNSLVREFLSNNEAVRDSLDENLEELIEVFCDLKCIAKDQQSTLESYVEIMEWLDKNSDRYVSNFNNCGCEGFNSNVEEMLKSITGQLLQALNNLSMAIRALENVQSLQNKLDNPF